MKRMVMDISCAVLWAPLQGGYTLGSLLLPLVMFGVCLALLGFGQEKAVETGSPMPLYGHRL